MDVSLNPILKTPVLKSKFCRINVRKYSGKVNTVPFDDLALMHYLINLSW